MKKQKNITKTINNLVEGYNALILAEVTTAAKFARNYPNTSIEEIIKFGIDRTKRILIMRDSAIAKILK